MFAALADEVGVRLAKVAAQANAEAEPQNPVIARPKGVHERDEPSVPTPGS